MKNMKKHIIILEAIIAAALLAPACYPEDAPGLKTEGLTISLFSDEPETKAYDPTFETAIDHFDFYFFKDAEGTQPIEGMHGRATGSTTTLNTGENQTYAPLRKIASYVYILANYPGSHPTTTNMTLAELLALDVNYPILTGKATKVNPISGDEEETGVVSFNPNLVMDSYHKETGATDFTYTVKIAAPTSVNERRTVDVGLSRLAAKLILKVNVAESVPGTMPTPSDRPEIWTPVLKELKAYYVNALNNKTTVAATPMQHPADTTGYGYVTYPTPYPITAASDNPYAFTADPAFTYPQTWAPGDNSDPYFKIQMIWKSNYRGTSNFYYKVRVPRAATNGACTLNRNTCYTVTVDLSVVDPENEYVELNANYKVVNWADSGWVGGDNLSVARFFNVPKTKYELFSRDSIEIPYYSSSTVTAYFEEISFIHYGNRARPEYTFTYGNETDVQIVLPTTDSNGQTVPTAARDRNTYSVEVVGKNVKFKHALTNVFTKRIIKVTIKNQEGDDEIVTIVQHPSIEVETIPTKTIFVNGHFARATEAVHVNGGGNEKIGVEWGPMKYLSDAGQMRYHSDDTGISGYWTFGSWQSPSYGGTESTCARIIPNVSKGIYGTVEGDWSFLGDPFMTIISVSAFDENNVNYTYIENNQTHEKKYRIGDPRVKGNLSLANYLYKPSTVRNNDGTTTTGTAVYQAWQEPLEVLKSSTNAADGNIIAPRFLLSSSLNCMTDGGNTFENAQKRAATYQEAGYPAGRWRLPTEAEIMFMIARQGEGVIPSVWGTTYYWCADGRAVSRRDTGSYFTTYSSGAYNRFVYDLWYWGDDPMEDTETYYPNMHLVTPNN